MRLLLSSSLLLLTVGCGAEVNEQSCAAICAQQAPAGAASNAAQGQPSLTSFEADLLADTLADIKGGVRPFNDEGIGIVEGKDQKSGFTYMGPTPGELPKGVYMLRADLKVPQIGEKGTWTITLDTECTTTRVTASGESSNTSSNSRTLPVLYAGTEHGYRLKLQSITSPSKGGARSCTYKITAPHPDGDKVYSGSWSTPAAE